jgi:hypothetical protein
MPLFDESHLPPGVPEEVMHGVNTVIAGLRGRLVKEIVLSACEGPVDQLQARTQYLPRRSGAQGRLHQGVSETDLGDGRCQRL